jgi:hypothetical protein
MSILQENKTRLEKPPTKSQNKGQGNFSLWFYGLIFFAIITGAAVMMAQQQSDEEYLAELSSKVEAGEYLASGEMRDYCQLLATLRDSISSECVCILDGINWDNPPRNPALLPDVWQEYKAKEDQGNRRNFKHKLYPKIHIDFDLKDKNGNERPHWHRLNPNKGTDKKKQYLDKNCFPVSRHSPESHIYTRK